MQADHPQSALADLPSLKRRSLGEEVTDHIRDVILIGVLQPGDRVGEAEFSQRLQVSRGPVREALVRLEQEGLVTIERHRGATVVDFTKKDVFELMTLRAVLEQLAVEEATRAATAADFASLDDVVEQMRSARERGADESLVRLDVEFHDTVYRAAHHERLYAAWTTIRSQVSLALLRRRVINLDYPELVVDEHAALAATLAERNADNAKEQIAVHIDGAYSRLLTAYDTDNQ
jgi:DNA-binding GntR family transcriptional regulator